MLYHGKKSRPVSIKIKKVLNAVFFADAAVETVASAVIGEFDDAVYTAGIAVVFLAQGVGPSPEEASYRSA